MTPAASFAERWARDNLSRDPTPEELTILGLFPATCDGDEDQASKRARRYYRARGPGGISDLWHKRHPDDEDILSSCQDAYIVPLRAHGFNNRRITIVRLPAPSTQDRSLSAKALLSRWLMILDIRLREDPTPGEEVIFIDVSDLQPSHLKNHFKGNYWKDFLWCIKNAYPLRFTEVHVINTERLKTISLLLLHIGLYPWRRKVVQIHATGEDGMGYCFPVEGLPYEYGGKAGAMKDLNDEWTKKLLSNSKWLQTEERRFYDTDLKPEVRTKTKHRNAITTLRGAIGSYDMITRTHSCKSLHSIKHDDLDDGLHGAYRTIKFTDKLYF